MTTLSFLFDMTPALAIVIHEIESIFICFTDYDMVDDDLEITIRCRSEDAAGIERRLAPFV